MTGKPLTITLPADVLEKVEALAAADRRTIERFVEATVIEKVTGGDRHLLLIEERLGRILANAAERGHTHGSAEAIQ